MSATPVASSISSLQRDHLPITGAAIVAVAVPALLALNYSPSATFFNQAAALIGWSLVLLCWAPLAGQWAIRQRGLAAMLAALALLGASTLGAWAFAGLPGPLAWSPLGLIAAAALVTAGAAALSQAGHGDAAMRSLCVALAVTGVLCVAVSVVQVFIPGWADGTLIAPSAIEGRATGNLRQPNHLSSLLLWSVIAVLWLGESERLKRAWSAGLALTFVFALVLAASRTGVVGIVILGLWGALDRRLSRWMRVVLVLAPVAYLLFFGGLALWAHESQQVFGGEARLSETADSPNSRLNIWANTLSLIAQHPWLGVGFGEFNFAWSLTPFPHRPTAFFDHTHDLVLQLAVELGLPLAALVMALLVYSLWRAFVAGRDAHGPHATMLRAAFMMVLMILLHSMFEYPLWYAYFLLPAAFLWGLCLGADGAEAAPKPAASADASASGNAPSRRVPRSAWLLLGSLAMLVGGIASVFDYLRVAAIFETDRSTPLAQRILDGERSWFFAHHAYYAAATVTDHPSDAMPAFKVATHYLLDTRLMMAWAKALDESGDVERARYVAQRLREFRNEDAKPFFAPCDEPATAGTERPFQCTPPSKQFDYRDFR